MDFTNKRAAFYLRGKTPKTLDRQMTEILIFASKNNIMLTKDNVFIDEANSEDSRPNLLRLMERHEEFDVLVVHNYAVIHIDTKYFKTYADALEKIMNIEIVLLEGKKEALV